MENIAESNKLIAEFMGAKVYPLNPNFYTAPLNCPYGFLFIIPDDFKYNNSWDWLMPVVEKINNCKIQGNPEIRIGKRVEVFYSPLINSGKTELKMYAGWESSTIEYVYKAVTTFIRWYNLNK